MEQVKVLLHCLANASHAGACKSEINETASCVECEEAAIEEAEDEQRSRRHHLPRHMIAGVVASTAALLLVGALGFCFGKRSGRCNKRVVEEHSVKPPTPASKSVPPVLSGTKVVAEAWAKKEDVLKAGVVEHTPIQHMAA